LPFQKSEGDIVYEKVGFEYPTRKGTPILHGLNLTIKKSTTVALVGPSGSGKSTCVQLLLRYYDPVSGSVNLSVFLKDGVVAEQGTHEELMERRGLYCELVNITQRKEATEADEGAVVGRPLQKSQNLSDEETDDDEEDEEEDEEPELNTSGSSRDSGFRASTRRKRKYQKSDTKSMF